MKRFTLLVATLAACGPNEPPEQYGFVARLGQDTVSVESVTRRGNTLTSDGVDRFPRVRQRHSVITLGPDGGVKKIVMDIHTPSEPENQRDRRVVAEVTNESVRITKTDKTGELDRSFPRDGSIVMAHVSQMYSLIELYFAAALARGAATNVAVGDTVRLQQFYIDREFDKYRLHRGVVRRTRSGKVEIEHDWLAGTGVATIDSNYHMLHYSGARTTYQVEVDRLTTLPDVQAIGAQFAALETKSGMRQLSVRDTTHTSIGGASLTIDYGRPLARGRELLGKVVPYNQVWRTGANAATQFTTSVPITLGGLTVPSGTYTLWTMPRADGVDLIVNKQNGQWGTEYNGSLDLGKAPMKSETLSAPVEEFTISIVGTDGSHGTLAIEWGPFRWTAPIVVLK